MSKCKGECFVTWVTLQGRGWGNIAEANKQNSRSNLMHGIFWMKNLEGTCIETYLKGFQMVWTFHEIFQVILELTFKKHSKLT